MSDMDDQFDPDIATARFNSLADAGDEKGFWDKVGAARAGAAEAQQTGWLTRLPKNIGTGAYKAALSTIETATDVANEVAAGAVESSAVPVAPPPSVREIVPEFYDAAHAFGDELSANNTLSDDITQGVAQFTLPFMAWMKGLQGAGMVGTVARGLVAETATAATAFDPHDGRLADLAQLGLQAENKFGDVLRKIAPDGSLVNNYIDYMTSRDGEGEWEGRFKNAVDSLAGTAVLGGVLKGAATGFKVARQAATAPMKVGPDLQGGMVAFHGTRVPEIEQFDVGKVGTGNATQSYGHGLYFTGSEDAASFYSTTSNGTGKPTVYKVDVADDAPMIDWDAPLSAQAPNVRAALDTLVKDNRALIEAYAAHSTDKQSTRGFWSRELVSPTDGEVDGETVYRALADVLGSQQAVSEALNKAGVKGIRYVDQTSRGAAPGTRNHVVFDSSVVKILGKE